MGFLKNVLATIVGLFVFFAILAVMGLAILFAAASSGDDVPRVKDGSILHLNLSGVVVEQKADEDAFGTLLDDGPKETALLDILESISAAKDDDRIEGIYLETNFMMANMANREDIRLALEDFKESGKFIYAYGLFISEADYYLASVADEIHLNPYGSLEFNGMSVNVTFFTGMLEKLEIEPVIFRVGAFKSAVEPFLRKDLSEENELQYSELLNSIYDHYLQGVSDSRGVGFDELERLSDDMLVNSAEEAKQNELITHISYEDEVKERLKEELDLEADDKLKFVSVENYAKAVRADRKGSRDKVAVIVADGTIVASGTDGVVGGDDFAKFIRKARENDRVKAIVLRINSPGGNAVASDLMWREVERTRGVKPIIASFGGVAASGGYYMAMNCDTIVAQPNTITGSIGIFAMLYNFENFLDNKLGITNDQVGTGDYSDFVTVNRTMTDYEKSIIQTRIESFYDDFVAKVAEGRGLDESRVRELAGGRVWSGIQAKENGLVDVLGDYRMAMDMAADMADMEEYSVVTYPKPKSFTEELFSKLDDSGSRMFMKDPILAAYQKKLTSLRQMNGIQALLPGDPEIQ